MAAEGDGDDGKVIAVTGRRCPICSRPAIVRFRPFCSKRCADIDLGKWLKEDYRVASNDEPDEDDADSPQ